MREAAYKRAKAGKEGVNERQKGQCKKKYEFMQSSGPYLLFRIKQMFMNVKVLTKQPRDIFFS